MVNIFSTTYPEGWAEWVSGRRDGFSTEWAESQEELMRWGDEDAQLADSGQSTRTPTTEWAQEERSCEGGEVRGGKWRRVQWSLVGRQGEGGTNTGSRCSLLQRQSRTWVWHVYKGREHGEGRGGVALVSAGQRRDREVWGSCRRWKKGEKEEHERNVSGGESKKKCIEQDRPGKEEGGACHWKEGRGTKQRGGEESKLLRAAQKRGAAAAEQELEILSFCELLLQTKSH